MAETKGKKRPLPPATTTAAVQGAKSGDEQVAAKKAKAGAK